jgi:thiol-disulfide isomerase/thioredoxin
MERLVSSTDTRFAEKVLIITITGSWCPNCHDEAPFLEDLYQRHRKEGLEIVALAFEYTGDAQRDAEQLKSFVRRHSLTFPVLLAGTTDEGEMARKLPQIENFGGYPTTLFVGRDGLVRRIHTGFDGAATGARFVRLKAEMEELVKSLLAE